jgi:hypothetical protein
MRRAVHNLGRPGLVAEAISAVDIALWDLHAQLLDVPSLVCVWRGARPGPDLRQRPVHLPPASSARFT